MRVVTAAAWCFPRGGLRPVVVGADVAAALAAHSATLAPFAGSVTALARASVGI